MLKTLSFILIPILSNIPLFISHIGFHTNSPSAAAISLIRLIISSLGLNLNCSLRMMSRHFLSSATGFTTTSIRINREAETKELSKAEAGKQLKEEDNLHAGAPGNKKDVSFMTRMLREVLDEARGRKGGTDDTGNKED